MNKCTKLQDLCPSLECGTERTKSSFKLWVDNSGQISIYNQRGDNVTEYFNVSVVDGVVVMNYKKEPSFDEWRKIVGKE